MNEHLHQRIANALGWTLDEVRQFSLPSLRALVRRTHPKLAREITLYTRSPDYYLGEPLRPGRRFR